MKSKKTKHLLGRNWTFELYPDSMDPEYRSKINALHCEWAESPVHDKDVRADGSPKKPHIHVVLSFEGNKSYEQIKEICNSVKGVIAPEFGSEDTALVHSIRGMVRYLVHRDDADKYQYEQSGIVAHGGMDIDQYFGYPQGMIKRMIQEMMAWCDANSIFEYCDLLDYATKEKYDTWFDLLTIGRQSFVMIKYLDSKRNSEFVKNKIISVEMLGEVTEGRKLLCSK